MLVTLQTVFHQKRALLSNSWHFTDHTMAGHAADSFGNVHAMVKINVSGQAVYLQPLKRFVLLIAIPHGFQDGAVFPDLRMAGHAGLGIGEPGIRTSFDRRVAESAIEPQALDMVLMTKGDGLFE
jgi:hypothetical protein